MARFKEPMMVLHPPEKLTDNQAKRIFNSPRAGRKNLVA
jgi:hypothetical protein